MKKIILTVLFGLMIAAASFADAYIGFVDYDSAVAWSQSPDNVKDSIASDMIEKYNVYANNLKAEGKKDGKKYTPDVIFYYGVKDGQSVCVAVVYIASTKNDYGIYLESLEGKLDITVPAMQSDDRVWDISNAVINEYTSYDFPCGVTNLNTHKIVWNTTKVKTIK